MEVENLQHPPIVVTPAPSSPESMPKDLERLWQGRLASRRIDATQLDEEYAVSHLW